MPHRSRSLVLCAALLFAQDEPNLLSPPNGASFASGPVRVIARAEGKPEITVDGKPIALESPVDGVATANLKLEPGAHVVGFGKESAKVFVGEGAPTEFKPFRFHPAMASCTSCHAVKNGVWAFQRPSLVTTCGQCHAKEKFPAKHTHEMGILADCQICHDPHGSTAAGHLRKQKDVACKQCHN